MKKVANLLTSNLKIVKWIGFTKKVASQNVMLFFFSILEKEWKMNGLYFKIKINTRE